MNWLDQLLKEAGITPAELSRRSFLDEGLISRIRKGKIRATTDTLKAIATGLKLPLEIVYRAAGELPAKSKRDELEEEAAHLFAQLKDKQTALKLLRALGGDDDEKKTTRSGSGHSNAIPR